MKSIISSLIVGVVVGLGVSVTLDYAFGIPDVKFSYSTNECVEVQNYPTTFFGTSQYSCENMPKKYHHIWVK